MGGCGRERGRFARWTDKGGKCQNLFFYACLEEALSFGGSVMFAVFMPFLWLLLVKGRPQLSSSSQSLVPRRACGWMGEGWEGGRGGSSNMQSGVKSFEPFLLLLALFLIPVLPLSLHFSRILSALW